MRAACWSECGIRAVDCFIGSIGVDLFAELRSTSMAVRICALLEVA
jgi:hypothetical protein